MAINLEAIRKKLQAISGESYVKYWKPKGESIVRALPWKEDAEGTPIKEKWFYFFEGQQSILAPYQYGKKDPINDFIRKIQMSQDPDDKKIVKMLKPKMQAYLPIIVRGEEAEGVVLWKFGTIVYQRLLSFFLNKDIGNFLDPYEGFDLEVKSKKTPGKKFTDTIVDAVRRPSLLVPNKDNISKLLESVPPFENMFENQHVLPDEIERRLNTWLEGKPADSFVESPQQNSKKSSILDDVVKEIKQEVSSTTIKKKSSLDDAFADLIND